MLENYKAKMTYHSQKRMNERVKVKSKKRQERLSKLAWERGMIVKEEKDQNIRKIEFDHLIFVFKDDGLLITLYKKTEDHSYRKLNFRERSWKKKALEEMNDWEEEDSCDIME